jgi:hypothetical protein
MKWFIVLLILTSRSLAGQSPTVYTVVRVVGKVESTVLKRELRPGDKLQSKDQLKFGTKDSYVWVNSPQTGRKKIAGIPDSAPREFLQLLESFVRPEYKSTASRSISLQYVETLQNSMAFDTLLVLGNGFVPVNTEKLSLSPPAAIKGWYTLNRKTIYKVISNEEGFSLSAAQLFDQRNAPLPKVMLEYFTNAEEDPVFNPGILLAAFVPAYPDEAALSNEIKILLADLSSKSYSDKLLEIKAYLAAEYARPQEDNLKAWLTAQKLLQE